MLDGVFRFARRPAQTHSVQNDRLVPSLMLRRHNCEFHRWLNRERNPGRLNHHMEDDLSRADPHAVAHRPADDHVTEHGEPQPPSHQRDSAPIIHPSQEGPSLSSANFDSGVEESRPVTAITMWMQRGRRIWRGHLEREQLPEPTARPTANVERWLLALLSVVLIVICVSATIAFMQVKSLKAEIATVQRDIITLRLRTARLDQIASANEARD